MAGVTVKDGDLSCLCKFISRLGAAELLWTCILIAVPTATNPCCMHAALSMFSKCTEYTHLFPQPSLHAVDIRMP